MSWFVWKMPPIRMVEFPVKANLTGTLSPTERWSEFAVDVSISRFPAVKACGVPEAMVRIRVCDRFLVVIPLRLTMDCLNSNCPPYTVEVDVTPGTPATTAGTVVLNAPGPLLLELLTMMFAAMAWSMLAVADCETDAPNTAMTETKASPTIKAEAVWAVRRGLRMEFSRPRRPDTPSRRASGRPITLDIGRATAGARRATPTKISSAPIPTSAMAGLVSPTARASAPSRVIAAPQVKRRRMEISCSPCCSDTASTGAMRTARRAGLMAETTVTPTPTTRQTMTVRGSKAIGPEGRVTPKPLSSASSPMAASTPRPRPINDETKPTMAASPITDRKTWRRLAPTMRRRANSLVRWPTMIENVLRIVKPPTKSEMKAKTRRAVLKNPSAWPIALVASLMTV